MRVICGNVVNPHVLVVFIYCFPFWWHRVSATPHREQPTASCLFFAPDRFAHGSVRHCAAVPRVGQVSWTHRPPPTGSHRDRAPRPKGEKKTERARARWRDDAGQQRVRNISSLCHMRGEFCIMINRDDAFWMYCWVIHTGNTAGKGLRIGQRFTYWTLVLWRWLSSFIYNRLSTFMCCNNWYLTFTLSTGLELMEKLSGNKSCMELWQWQTFCKCSSYLWSLQTGLQRIYVLAQLNLLWSVAFQTLLIVRTLDYFLFKKNTNSCESFDGCTIILLHFS